MYILHTHIYIRDGYCRCQLYRDVNISYNGYCKCLMYKDINITIHSIISCGTGAFTPWYLGIQELQPRVGP